MSATSSSTCFFVEAGTAWLPSRGTRPGLPRRAVVSRPTRTAKNQIPTLKPAPPAPFPAGAPATPLFEMAAEVFDQANDHLLRGDFAYGAKGRNDMPRAYEKVEHPCTVTMAAARRSVAQDGA